MLILLIFILILPGKKRRNEMKDHQEICPKNFKELFVKRKYFEK